MGNEIKSVLRYPGGKSKALDKILPLIPNDFKEFREPFVGGGSVSIAVKQRTKHKAIFKINDLNFDLYCFWKYLKEDHQHLIERITQVKNSGCDGRELYKQLNTIDCTLNDFERAVRFFILNRITFSGTVDSGGYSQQAFEKRFTISSINRLNLLAPIIRDFEITCGSYEELLFQNGYNVFIFLDPPYLKSSKSKLYGVNGQLHSSFDHEQFAFNVKKCPHRWLITYDDSPEIRKLFNFAYVREWELQYSMNNYKQNNARKGKELFITNY